MKSGNIAGKIQKKFCFQDWLFIKLIQFLASDFQKLICQMFIRTKSGFFLKKKEYLNFSIFGGYQDFFRKMKFAGNMPAYCRQTAKKFFGKKIKNLKNVHEFVFFSIETFFSKNLR